MAFFEIDFLEAGTKSSGDAIALRYEDNDGATYIHVVDGGYTDDGDKLVAHIKKYYGDPEFVDNVVLTHPDGDHAAGLGSVLEGFEVGALWMNRPWNHLDDLLPRFEYHYTQEGLKQRLRRDFPNTAELEKLAEEKGIQIKDAFQGDQIGSFTVLAPSLDRYLDLVVDSDKTPEPERAAVIKGTIFERTVELLKKAVAVWGAENLKGESDGTSRENETSVVQFANLCGEKILLTGDAGVEALNEAHEYAMGAEIEVSPRIDRFDVPHHGSRRNVSSDVLDKWLGTKLSGPADPPLCTAVISANRNDEEHPRNAVVRALIHRGAKAVQTEGTIRTGHNAPEREGWSAVAPLTYPTDMEE